LKNLVTDKPSPITTKLAQKSDGDNVFAFDGSNVTRGNLKNLVTDKPSPITTKLAQLSEIDGPITKTLLQMEKSDSSAYQLSQGVPVHVNPVVMQDTMHNENLGMKILVGPDDIALQKRETRKTALAQLSNPVVNPPFNNWSVNQPSPPHQRGLDGKADLGQNILIDGHPVHFAQVREEPLQGMAGTETVYGPAVVGGDNVVYKKGKEAPLSQAQVNEQVDMDVHVDGSVINLQRIAQK